MSMRRWLLLLPLTVCRFAGADGPTDNSLEKVRPVPPKGITIADADRSALQAGVRSIG